MTIERNVSKREFSLQHSPNSHKEILRSVLSRGRGSSGHPSREHLERIAELAILATDILFDKCNEANPSQVQEEAPVPETTRSGLS